MIRNIIDCLALKSLIALFFLVLIVLMPSCKGQSTKKNQPISPAEYIDELFFIEGQFCQHLRHIFQDSNDNLWFGTNIYGVMMYNGDTLAHFDDHNGFIGGRVTGILEGKEGNIWISKDGGLTMFDYQAYENGNQPFKNFGNESGLKDTELWAQFVDSRGTYWVGTYSGPLIFDGTSFKSFELEYAFPRDTSPLAVKNRITSMAEDQNGRIWFAMDGMGITIYDPIKKPTFSFINSTNGLPDDHVGAVFADSKGNVWIGTNKGLSAYHGMVNGSPKIINYSQDKVIDGDEVGAFFEDKNGDIWFAAENYGVYKYANDKGTFQNFYTDHGLETNGILAIQKDRQDRFWFGGWGGLFRFDDKRFTPVAKDGPWE